MATSESSGRRKASKRPFPAAASEPSTNGPVQATDLVAVGAKRSKPSDTSPSKTKIKKENDVTIAHKTNDSDIYDNQGTKQVLVFNWTSEELTQLITNLSTCLPRNDNVKYTTLIDKLDWEKVRFGPYTAAQCKEKWMQIVTKLRRFRTLTDMVTDAKVWLKHPWSSYSSSKKQKHPEMPKKPLTPYFRYFLEKREKYSKDNPEMSMTDLAKLLSKKFQQLPEKKKLKYREAYEKENEGYKLELEKFKRCHPDQFPTPEMRQHTTTYEGPDKPLNAFNIFVNDRLKKLEFSQIDKREAMDKLRKLWSNLSDNKKVKWIRKAVQDEQRYGMEVEKYRTEHPDFHPEPVKNVLSKAEKELKDRCDGKPERPPNSGYSLFSRIKLRELKDLPSKSKMGEISRMWKQLSDTEREGLNKQAQIAIAKYKEEYATYLNNLPENEREKVENEMKPANRKKAANHLVVETNNNIAELEAIEGARPKKPLSAMFYFQQEKFAVARQKHPDMSKQDVMKLLAKDYNELSEKKKEKYKKIAEEAKKAYDEGSTSKGKHETSGKKKLFKGEPKCPPQNGYGLFLSENLSEMTHVDPKLRMSEIPKMWKAMSPAEKEVYSKRVKEMMRKYNKDMQKFLKGLTVAEFQEYDKYRKATMKKKNKKAVETPQKAVKKESESDSSDDDSSDDDEDSDKSDGDDSASGSGSGSGSSSGSDDSDSDSGSDDDDDDDDEDDDDDDEEDGDEDEKKNGEDNESSSSDSDSSSGSDSGSDSDGSSDSGSDKSDNEEKSS